jgi:hypothetical protein
MKTYLLVVIFFYSQICFGKDTFLSCVVGGTVTHSNGTSLNIPNKKVTVEISEIVSKFISINGEDDYILSVSTSNNPPPPTRTVLDFSNENKYDITNMLETPNRNIVRSTSQITINRLTGLISYSASSDFKNGSNLSKSLSGSCEKVSSRKF